jgi:hypothetical protein
MVSKPLKRFSAFKRKANLIPFSTRFGFKSYWRNSLKTRPLSKVLKFCFRKTKVLRFNQKMLSNQSLWLSFVLKKWFTIDLLNKILAKRFCL